jgi:hypothetical protein
MKLFFTENHIINIAAIATVNKQRGVVTMVSDTNVSLSKEELRNLESVLEEVHRQACFKE